VLVGFRPGLGDLPEEARPGLPVGLDELYRRAVCSVERRFPTAAALRAALGELVPPKMPRPAEARRPQAPPPLPEEAPRHCDMCGAEVPSGGRFCDRCGEGLARPAAFCDHCGHAVTEDARYCERCGTVRPS
jgi:predicted nucleic acid-binding Zn ribbon protein